MAFRQQVLITLQKNCQSELIWHQLISICKGQPCGIDIEFLDYWGLSYLFSLPSNLFLLQRDLKQICKKNFQYSLYFMTLEFLTGIYVPSPAVESQHHYFVTSRNILQCYLSAPGIIVSSYSTVSSLHTNKFHSESAFLNPIYV